MIFVERGAMASSPTSTAQDVRAILVSVVGLAWFKMRCQMYGGCRLGVMCFRCVGVLNLTMPACGS